MRKGVLKFFNLKKGFGFIEDEETGEQYFVRYRSFLPNKIRMIPAANSRVSLISFRITTKRSCRLR